MVYDHSDDPVGTLFYSIDSLRIFNLSSGQSRLISPQIGEPYNNQGYHADWSGAAVCPAGLEYRDEVCQLPQTIVIFATKTPQGTPAPTVTPSPAPTSTLMSPAELATVFPLPMQPTPGTPEARLSDFDYVDRAYERLSATPNAQLQVTPLCSRDANPTGVSGGYHNLIASAKAEVWFTSTLGNAGDNGGLGRMVVMRIRIQDLPEGVRQNLIVNVENSTIAQLIAAASTTNENVGWLYIAYGHMSHVPFEIDVDKGGPYPIIQPWQSVGDSGISGLSGDDEHLDVSVFYVSGQIDNVNGINVAAREPDNNVLGNYDYSIYFKLYKARYLNSDYTEFGYIELVDPLVIWPHLSTGVSNAIDYSCP